MSRYEMWFTCNGESEKIQIPVLPEIINIDRGTKNQSVHIADFGEVTIMQSRTAVNIIFSSFFPVSIFSGCSVDYLREPHVLVETIIKWKDSKKPVHFVCTGTQIDLFCSIESFNIHENGGDVGTIYYSIQLREYREVVVREMKVDTLSNTATVDTAPSRVDNTTIPNTYTVERGDCLWNIAQRFLGGGANYTKIKELNGLKSNLIFPKQVLRLTK